MNANFLQEMTSVQESFDMWKVNHYDDGKIPTNGIVQAKSIRENGRLYGEIAYYRRWAESEDKKRPEKDVLNKNCFDDYDGDLLVIPRGIEDLYYLNNKEIGIENDNVYIIDAVNSMIYKVSGYTIKDVDVHSLAMYKEVTGGSSDVHFASAEASGSGDYLAYAGQEYLKNKQGNYVDENGNIVDEDHKVKNPNGFKIIAAGDNIFKLYNNGDLYGKGKKGAQLNTSPEKMKELNQYEWQKWNVPSEVGEYKKIIISPICMFFIDKNDDLWAYGSNSKENLLGLTAEQLVDYTGREAVKINLNGKKVKNVFSGVNSTFLITLDNEVLAAGFNSNYELGLGDTRLTSCFEKVNVENVENIQKIYCSEHVDCKLTVIKYNDNTFYMAGCDSWNVLGKNKIVCKTFTKIFDGKNGPDIDQDIEDFSWTSQCILIKKDGTVWFAGYKRYMGEGLSDDTSGELKRYDELADIKKVLSCGCSEVFLLSDTGLCYAMGGNAAFGEYASPFPKQIDIPNTLKITDIWTSNNSLFLSSNGKLFGLGRLDKLGVNNQAPDTSGKVLDLGFSDINLYKSGVVERSSNGFVACALLSKDSIFLTTGSFFSSFSNDFLEKNWALVAENVKYFNGKGCLYVDFDGNLWVAGDSRVLGLGERLKNYEYISNYEICTDENIKGKVEKCWYSNNVSFVLLNDGTLWATGLNKVDPLGTRIMCAGWGTEENKTDFVKILDSVVFFDCFDNCDGALSCNAINENGDVYGWGKCVYGAFGIEGTSDVNVPTKISLSVDIGAGEDIVGLKKLATYRTAILTKNKGILFTGSAGRGWDGGKSSYNTFGKYDLNLSNDEFIVDIVSSCVDSCLFLTDKGKVFGFGPADKIGVGATSSDRRNLDLIASLSDKEINSISAGNGFYIVTCEDGSVFGTGINSYGSLGRWLGLDRTTPNSRYKTAFDWVECPELEL